MSTGRWRSMNIWRGSVLLAYCLMLIIATVRVGSSASLAQEESGLTPVFGNGQLLVIGAGFQPNERVVLSVTVSGAARQQFSATADPQGRFQLDTGAAVPPGSSVHLEARGDQGTVTAAITTGSPPASLVPTLPDPVVVEPTVPPWSGADVRSPCGEVPAS